MKPTSCACILMSALTVTTAAAPRAWAQIPPGLTLTGPVSGGEHGQPFGGFARGDTPRGYVETEWFLGGTATSYVRANEWGTDGRWDVSPDGDEPFRVRMLVRRPADPAAFNGIVVVEWLNVTARAEGAADYSQMAEELVRGGYAWVGVGAQAIGIDAPGTGLKAWDASRYEPLRHPGDAFSYDIFSQAARAVRGASGRDGLLGGLRLEHLIATGRSQSAFRLVTYVNALHPRDHLFDGYFVHSRGANAAGLRAEALAADEPDPIPPGAWIREDIDVPVFDLQTEGDMVTLGAHQTHQPANDHYRRWEVPGAAHTEIARWVVDVGADLPHGPGCANPVNAAPHHALVKSGLRALVHWVASGVVPPQSPQILLGDPTAADPIARDEHGNALGGIRIPELEAPTATLDGRRNSMAGDAGGGQNFCFLYGNTSPFDRATLRALYPDHDTFVERFVSAVDGLERAGYLLGPEAEEARAAAMAAGVGR